MASPEFVRPARVGDAARIVELVRRGFAPDLVESFIYGCHGIESYVAQQIAAADLGIDTQYIVAERSGEVVGCIEMRLFPDRLFLSYIAVDSTVRKQGCGSRLLATAIDQLRRPEHAALSLDVLESNLPARAWYESLGMRVELVTAWCASPLPASRPAATAIVTSLVQARLSHREFGFGQFTVSSDGKNYGVGLLGDRWFRVTSHEVLGDPNVLACLAKLDPDRRILALIPTSAAPPDDLPFARTLRMTAALSEVRAQLMERS